MKLKWLKRMMPRRFMDWVYYFIVLLGLIPFLIIAFACVKYLLLTKAEKLHYKGKRCLPMEKIEALKHFNEALEIDPDYWIVYRDRSKIYLMLARYDDAISDLTKAIELNPYSSKSYYYRGNIYDELERYEEAIEDYTRAISVDPVNGSYYGARGDTYKKIGNIEKAKEDYYKGCELGTHLACERLKPYIIKERKEKREETDKNVENK